jgi:hypothetical protein
MKVLPIICIVGILLAIVGHIAGWFSGNVAAIIGGAAVIGPGIAALIIGMTR